MRFCEFCKILKQEQNILFEDEKTFIFHDFDNKSAAIHLLACSKEHIESVLDLKLQHIPLLKQMQKNLQKTIEQLSYSSKSQYRFGYHKPPYTSIDHLHLHAFLLPFKSKFQDLLYSNDGLLVTTDKIIQSLYYPRL